MTAAATEQQDLFEAVYGDALFRVPTQRLAEAHASAGGTTYLCELTWPAPGLGGILGACHSLDVPLLFGSYDSPGGRAMFGEGEPTAETLAVADRFRTAWTTFASTGAPGWPAYRSGERCTHTFSAAPPTTAPYAHESSRRIWDGHELAPFDLLEAS
ncbi:carboxylesterase family protein [Nonomuraea insulae]|uniref:Carboxylesterase family protein n=1 Tax=Nonomuraea insulae TaxID=1616787 RepID=A0ABW1CCR0_9ACTN